MTGDPRGHLACPIRAPCCDWLLPLGIPRMGDWVKEAAPACDSQLISPGTSLLPVHCAPCPVLGGGAAWRGGQRGGRTQPPPSPSCLWDGMEGIPFSTSGAPVPKQREEEQTSEAASNPDCLERRLDPQRAKVESGSHHVWSQSWHCPPKWRHQAPAPTRSLPPCLSPSPGPQPDLTLEAVC